MSEKNNKYTPNLRFPEFSGEWEETKLGEVTRNEDSKRRPISKIDRAVGEYPYYGANGIQDHVNDYIFDGDYLLVGEDGTVLTKENTPVINWASGKFWVNNHAHVLSPKDDTSLKLISYLLSRAKIDGLVTGIPPKLNQDNLNTISIPLPPSPAEQDKIASCLSTMDDLIAAQAEKVEALKEKKTGLMQQLFPQPGETTPRLRFPEFTGEWEEYEFGDCFEIGSGRDYKHLDNGHIPVYGSGGYMCSVNDYLYDGESACIGRKGTINNPILLSGKFWTVDTLFYTYNYVNTTAYFIYLLFQNIDWMKHNEAGGVPSLSKNIINKIKVFIPSLTEQQKISECLSALDDQIAAETEKLTALKDYKKGLMQQLFPQPAK